MLASETFSVEDSFDSRWWILKKIINFKRFFKALIDFFVFQVETFNVTKFLYFLCQIERRATISVHD